MAFDGSGVYSLNFSFQTEAASPPIAIDKLDTEFAGIAAGLSLAILRNGAGKPTADIDWNAKKITNLANATADADALNRATADGRYVRAGDTASITGAWTFTERPTISSAFAVLQFLDSDLTETTGKRWYIGANADLFFVYRNTAAAGDFSTYDPVLVATPSYVRWMGNDLAVMTSGSFTATLASASSGGTVYVTGTAYWSKVGNLVTLTLPATFKAGALSGNLYAFVRGLPAAIRSACAIQQTVSVPIEDESTYLTGLLEIFTGSVDYMRLYTASGTYGFTGTSGFYSGATFTYRVSD